MDLLYLMKKYGFFFLFNEMRVFVLWIVLEMEVFILLSGGENLYFFIKYDKFIEFLKRSVWLL